MGNEYNKISLSKSAKKEYLNAVISRTYKILHLIEEEKTTGFSPKSFIEGFLFELNAANDLYDGKLVSIIVKIKGILKEYEKLSFAEIKKQVFEIKRIVNRLLKELED